MPTHRKKRCILEGKSAGNRIKEETGNHKINCTIPGQPYEEKPRDRQKKQVYRCKSRVFSINHFR